MLKREKKEGGRPFCELGKDGCPPEKKGKRHRHFGGGVGQGEGERGGGTVEFSRHKKKTVVIQGGVRKRKKGGEQGMSALIVYETS